jgi:hypothetical protein
LGFCRVKSNERINAIYQLSVESKHRRRKNTDIDATWLIYFNLSTFTKLSASKKRELCDGDKELL